MISIILTGAALIREREHGTVEHLMVMPIKPFVIMAAKVWANGLLLILTILPLQMLSGGITPRESMPDLVQNIMLVAPTTHFVSLAQAILYRGAGLDVVWPQMLALVAIGVVFFSTALALFRRHLAV